MSKSLPLVWHNKCFLIRNYFSIHQISLWDEETRSVLNHSQRLTSFRPTHPNRHRPTGRTTAAHQSHQSRHKRYFCCVQASNTHTHFFIKISNLLQIKSGYMKKEEIFLYAMPWHPTNNTRTRFLIKILTLPQILMKILTLLQILIKILTLSQIWIKILTLPQILIKILTLSQFLIKILTLPQIRTGYMKKVTTFCVQ